MAVPQEPRQPDGVLQRDRLDYTPFPKSVTLARRRAHRLLAEWGHPELAADAALLVSELGGNAVLHGCLRDRLFRVELTLTERALRIDVSDPKGELLPIPRHASDDDMFGRGLLIVREVADRWGVCERAVGKSVWAELDVVREAASMHHCEPGEPRSSGRATMAEPLKAVVNGVAIEVPNSIPDIRAALPDERREERAC
ncbi:ATP-binding protein [Streptomyces sp. GESEQ-4]|uniref:ATP-binding protein n=1 Tax=Streptomyces sp. GESEQ-4 TaxID=2812655 RepID=UPI001B33686B|nr:ATP-binding protein [Streptomyces sp. GESEQ-4]